MGWKAKAEREGGEFADKMPAGIHRATVVRVMRERKDGTTFTSSRTGAPQLMVVFANAHDEEAVAMFTLSDKADWVLAKFMSCAGIDLDRMDADGITTRHFEDADFAAKQLMDRECWILVEYKSGSDFPKVGFLKPEEVPASELRKQGGAPTAGDQPTGDHVPLGVEEIPF